MCQIRIRRQLHPRFINIEQTPSTHHFCSKECKYLWIEYIKKTGKIPKAYIEMIVNGEIKINE